MSETNEKMNKLLREPRADVIISDSYSMPEHHAELNRTLLESYKAGTFETNQDGVITHLEGKPVRRMITHLEGKPVRRKQA